MSFYKVSIDSSYRHSALGAEDALISPHSVYEYLGSSDFIRHNRYRGLFNEELDRELIDDIRLTTNACRVLGNDAFKDQIESMLKRRVRPAKIGRPRNKPIA